VYCVGSLKEFPRGCCWSSDGLLP